MKYFVEKKERNVNIYWMFTISTIHYLVYNTSEFWFLEDMNSGHLDSRAWASS